GFHFRTYSGLVMKGKAVTVCGRILQRLLHTVTNGVIVILHFNDRDGNVGLVILDVVSEFSLTSRDHLVRDMNLSIREEDLPSNLCLLFPSSGNDAGVTNLAKMSALLRSLMTPSSSPIRY